MAHLSSLHPLPLFGWSITFIALVSAFMSGSVWVWLVPLGVGILLTSLVMTELTFLEFLGHVMAFGLVFLLLVTLVGSTVFHSALSGALYTISALVVATVLLLTAPASLHLRWLWKEELPVIVGSTVLFLFIAFVVARNGYKTLPDGREAFLLHGYVNGDTATLFALVHQAQETHGPVRINPFAAGTPLEYPTLVHRLVATIVRALNVDIARSIWACVPLFAFGMVTVLAALRRRFPPLSPPTGLWMIGGLLYVLALGWEGVVFPQTHTVLLWLFPLLIGLLLDREQSHRSHPWLLDAVTWTVALVLLFSNAVLGTAAVGVVVSTFVLRSVRVSRGERMTLLGGALILVALFLRFPPGQSGFLGLNVPYTAFLGVTAVALPCACILWVLREHTSLRQRSAIQALSIVLPLLTFATLFFSRHDIVADNASRFLSLLVLSAWPVLVSVFHRAGSAFAHRIRAVSSMVERAMGLVVAGLAVSVLAFPAAASVLQSTESLILSSPKRISPDELAAFRWIRDNTPSDAVFARAPESLFERSDVAPLGLPAFAGRAQLRSEFWLSPRDAIFDQLARWFQGEGTPPPGVDYLFCGPERRLCPSSGHAVFSSGVVHVIDIRQGGTGQ